MPTAMELGAVALHMTAAPSFLGQVQQKLGDFMMNNRSAEAVTFVSVVTVLSHKMK